MCLEIILRSCSSADLQSVGLGWEDPREDPREEGMAAHSSVLAWRSVDRGPWQATVYGVTQSQTRLKLLSTAQDGA